MGSFSVETDFPVAVASRDHTHPHGTKKDNSRWRRFNEKLYALLPKNPVRVLDLGCSGGGFVKDCLDDGHLAVGIEGSDYSLLNRRAEWATIPANLFTADITRPFSIREDGRAAMFDCVTSWEVMEHIAEEGLSQLFENISSHLAQGGVWVMSVSTNDEFHHITVRDRPWWLERLRLAGFVNRQEWVDYFGVDMVRGPTTHGNAGGSFHLAVTKDVENNA